LDKVTVPAKKGSNKPGPNPMEKGKAGTRRHLVSDRCGIPLAIALSAANVHDLMLFEELVGAIEPIKRAGRCRPRKRPEKLRADNACDDKTRRRALSERGINARITRKGIDSSETWGRHRWIVERTLAWLAKYRRLAIRYERHDDIHKAFLHLGCSPICLNYLA
jgi:transposase